MAQPDLVQRLALLPERVNGNAWLVRRGRFVSLEFGLALGDASYVIAVERGRIAALDPGPHLMRSLRFAVSGTEEGWRKFWQPYPPPHHHDIFALQKLGAFRIDGELQPLMANLLYFKDVLAAPREVAP